MAKRKLQQAKPLFSKPGEEKAAQPQAEVSSSNEPEAASPNVLPKVSLALSPCQDVALSLLAVASIPSFLEHESATIGGSVFADRCKHLACTH